MVHYPFIWLFLSYAEKYKPSLVVMGWMTFLGTLLMVGLAYAIMIFVDEPVRRYFKNKMEKTTLRAVRP
jgi:peptidoglycan/LPS O-acetylase OafA/YrhL